jgi:hypothetical protein
MRLPLDYYQEIADDYLPLRRKDISHHEGNQHTLKNSKTRNGPLKSVSINSLKTAFQKYAGFSHQTLKFMWNTALAHNGIGEMTRFNFPINREILFRYRTIPNIMVTFSASNEVATMLR